MVAFRVNLSLPASSKYDDRTLTPTNSNVPCIQLGQVKVSLRVICTMLVEKLNFYSHGKFAYMAA